jgi:hypothetical protein
MKTNLLLFLFMGLLLSSCEKNIQCEDNEWPAPGELVIEFVDIKSHELTEISIDLYSTDYEELPLHEDLKLNSLRRVEVSDLNPGTYYFQFKKLSCSGYCLTKVVFQMNVGQDKHILVYRTDYEI